MIWDEILSEMEIPPELLCAVLAEVFPVSRDRVKAITSLIDFPSQAEADIVIVHKLAPIPVSYWG